MHSGVILKTRDLAKGDVVNQFIVSRPVPVSLAIICREDFSTSIGTFFLNLARSLVERQIPVHLFCQAQKNAIQVIQGLKVHVLGENNQVDLLAGAQEFSEQVSDAFRVAFPDSTSPVVVLGSEWSSIPALLKVGKGRKTILSLHSIERRRSDMLRDFNHKIEEIEIQGLTEAQHLLVRTRDNADDILELLPSAREKFFWFDEPLGPHLFKDVTDAGAIKRRLNIGPIDPTVLFVGDMDEKNGPDLIMKSVPQLLGLHPKTHFVFVGEGKELWPLRVYAHYLYLEGSVRIPGHMEGQSLRELVQAVDLVVVPGRTAVTEWPALAAWAAGKPVVITQKAGASFCHHEQDSLLVPDTVDGITAGVNRILTDLELAKKLAKNGLQTLKEQFGWSRVARRFDEEMLSVRSAGGVDSVELPIPVIAQPGALPEALVPAENPSVSQPDLPV